MYISKKKTTYIINVSYFISVLIYMFVYAFIQNRIQDSILVSDNQISNYMLGIFVSTIMVSIIFGINRLFARIILDIVPAIFSFGLIDSDIGELYQKYKALIIVQNIFRIIFWNYPIVGLIQLILNLIIYSVLLYFIKSVLKGKIDTLMWKRFIIVYYVIISLDPIIQIISSLTFY